MSYITLSYDVGNTGKPVRVERSGCENTHTHAHRRVHDDKKLGTCAHRSIHSDGFSRVPDVVAQRYIAHSKARRKLRTFTLVTDLFIDFDQIMTKLPPTIWFICRKLQRKSKRKTKMQQQLFLTKKYKTGSEKLTVKDIIHKFPLLRPVLL